MNQQEEIFDASIGRRQVRVRVSPPNAADLAAAGEASDFAHKRALLQGALTRDTFVNEVVRRGLWDEHRQRQLEDLQARLAENEEQLAQISPSEGRRVAVKMRLHRDELRRLQEPVNKLDEQTAEARAIQAGFNVLVARCTTFVSNGKRVWADVGAYRRQSGKPVWTQASEAMARMYIGLVSGRAKNVLAEEAYLAKHGLPPDPFGSVSS